MNRGLTIFLVALAVALGGFVVIRSAMRQEPGKPPGSALFDFAPDEIRNVVITNGDAALDFRRTDKGWSINPAPIDRASAEAIRNLMKLALETPVLDRIDAGEIKDPESLAKYGLNKSRLQLDFKGDGDHPLLFGKDSADEARVYVRFQNSQDVYLVDDRLSRAIFRPVEEFRDRRLSNLRAERIERFVIRRPGGEIEIRRTAAGWRIVRPLDAAADDEAVTKLLNQVLGLKIQAFLDAEASESGSQDLTEPFAEVLLFAEGEAEPEVLSLATPRPEGGVLGRFSARDVTVLLPDLASKLVTTDLQTLRDRALARVNLDLVDRIRVVSKGRKFVVSRKAGEWEVQDGPKVGNASSAAVDRLVEALQAARVQRFEPTTVASLAKYGLDSPEREVEFLSVVSENTPESPAGEQSILAIAFGSKSVDGMIPVHISNSPEIAFVPPSILDSLPVEASSWVSP